MPPTTHATLGASSSERWMNCPGSIRLSEGMPDVSSPYAIEGTAAHEVGEICLRKGIDAADLIGVEIAVKDDGQTHHVEVTEEMVEAVQVYVDYVRERVRQAVARHNDSVERYIEKRFNLKDLNPPGPMYGTSDFVLWDPIDRELEVIDYKHGQGVTVDATENSQLRYYALGAVLSLNKRPSKITMTIVQPRGSHPDGIIRSDVITFEELVAFKHELFAAGERTTQPDAPLVPGEWCRFCKAQAVCPAMAEQAVAVARTEFEPFTPPAPEALTPSQFRAVLVAADQLVDWIRAVQSHALTMLENGQDVPGFKLVPKRATRKWKDEDGATVALVDDLGLDPEEIYTRKLISPAQAEKALKAAKRPTDGIEQLVVKESSGNKLAPADDPRPAALPSAVSDFAEEPVESKPRVTRKRAARKSATKGS